MKKKCCTSSENLRLIQQYKPWQKDFILDELGTIGLFNEYLEMSGWFGGVALVVRVCSGFGLCGCCSMVGSILWSGFMRGDYD